MEIFWTVFVVLISLGLLTLSGIFSANEIAHATVNGYKLETYRNGTNRKKSKQAKKVLKMLEDYNGFLTSNVFWNTAINAIVPIIISIFFVSTYGEWTLIIAIVVTTFVIIIYAEVIPKMLGRNYALQVSMMFANYVEFFYKIIYPLIFLLRKVYDNTNPYMRFTEMEVENVLKDSISWKEFDHNEVILALNSLRFDEINISTLMTDISKSYILKLDQPLSSIILFFKKTKLKRLSIMDKNNKLIGYV